MGLSISVGLLADLYHNDTEGFEYHREAFERLTRGLAGEGIDWREPDAVELPAAHEYSAGFPYGYLTRLRRIYVLAKNGEPITPAAEINTPQYERDLRLIDDETAMLDSHLLCHADDSGYYLPLDFPDPLFLPRELELEGGGMVGSCYRLLAELADIEPALTACSPKDSFEPEKYAWSKLHESCEASIEGGHAIVFC
jgi:hypothetical protein